MVLNQGRILPSWDIGQCLETFLFVTLRRVYYWHVVGGGRTQDVWVVVRKEREGSTKGPHFPGEARSSQGPAGFPPFLGWDVRVTVE